MWEKNARVIAEAGFRVIAPDLPGFGKNRLYNDTSGMDDMALGIKELLDSLGIGNAVFAGLSMGGYVLFSLLKQFPQYISAMVLCDTTAGSDTEERRQGRYELIERLEEEGSDVLVETMLHNLLSTHTLRNNVDLAERLVEDFRGCDPKAAAAALRGMALRPDSRDVLSETDLSTLFIFGEDDKLTGLEGAREMKDLVRRSRLEVIPEAGHYSNIENPEVFNRLMIGFLNSLAIST